MPLIWSGSPQQVTSIASTSSGAYAGVTANISVSTQGFASGGSIYYTTTGSGVQVTGTAVVTNYFGDLGTATIPIATSRTTSTSAFTITFYTGSLSGVQIINPLQPLTLSAPDPYFTATVLLLSPAGPGNTALTDISGTTSTINVSGTPNVKSLIPFTTPGVSSSMFFNGTTDYLSSPNNTALDLSTGTPNWTIECWIYPTSTSGSPTIVQKDGQNGTRQCQYALALDGSGKLYGTLSSAVNSSGNQNFSSSGAVIQVNAWTHVAFVRSGSSIYMFQNGQIVNGPTTLTATMGNNTGDLTVGINTGPAGYFYGYISNLRITKGLAVYTGAFTPPTSPLQTTQSADTNIAAITTQTVLLLLQAPQAANNNSFYDSANTGTQISYLGAPAQGTFSPFSQYATFFNGAGYHTIQASSALTLGTGDFTVEFWAYPTANQRQDWFDLNDNIATRLLVYYDSAAGGNIFYYNSAPRITGSPIVVNTWQHIAVVRISGVSKLYINGTQSGSNYTDTTNYTSQPLTIGKDAAGSTYVTGYIRNLRLIKGQGVYTSAFTPPSISSLLPATTNTSVLACQGPTFSDYSTFTNTVTTVGSVVTRLISTTTFLTSVYSTSTIAGSIYFGGSDYLTTTSTTSSSVVNFGTGNFTVDFWMYLTKLGVNQAMFDTRYPNVANTGFDISVSNTNQLRLGTNATFYVTGATTLVANQWYHVAAVRESTTVMKLYLNGIQESTTYTASATQNFINTTATIANGQNGYFNGFISNLRAINGYAAYTSNFRPSLTPVTASLTGTTMIINGNNSAVYDAAGYHNIATTGTATITTSPIKFGSTSIKISPTAGLNITTSSNAQLQLGTGPFTIEAWIQGKSNAQQKVIFDNRNPDTANAGFDFYLNTSNVLLFGTNGATYITGSTVLTNGLWYHVALVRESTTVIKMYLNGNQEGSTYTASATQNFTNYLTRIGFGINGTFDGYISDLRVTKYARYTANFTTATTYSQLM
jgi:hypothetical protein